MRHQKGSARYSFELRFSQFSGSVVRICLTSLLAMVFFDEACRKCVPATLLGLSFLSILTFPFFLRNPEYFTYMDVIHVHDAYLEIFHVQVRFFTSMYLCELRSNYVQLRSNYVQLRSITFKLRSITFNYVQITFKLRSITCLAYISKTIVGKSRPG